MAESKFAQILITAKDATKTGFDSAKANARELQGTLGGLSGSFTSVFGTATRVLPALAGVAGVFSAGGIVASVLATANALDAFNDAADATGASVENLSALEAIALRNGEGLEIVESAIVKLNQALSQKPDGAQAKVLEAIGLSAESLRNQDPAEALQAVAQALAKFENDGNKARIIFELFGRSAAQLAPFLNDVADAGELVATATAKQAQEAERFNKLLSGTQAEVTLLGRELGEYLLPIINRYAREIRAASDAQLTFSDLLKQGLTIPASPGEQLNDLRDQLDRLNASKESFGARGMSTVGIDNNIKSIKRRIEFLKALQRDEALAGTEAYGNEARGVRLSAPDITPAKVPKDTSDKLQRAAQTMVDDWSPLTLRWELDASDFDGGANADLAKWQAAASERLDDLISKYRDLADPAEKYRQELQVVTALEAQGRLTAEEAFNARLRLIEQEDQALGNRNEKLKESKSFAEEFGLTMSSAFESAIVAGKGLGETLQGLSRDIAQIIIRKSVTEPLGTAVSGFLKGIDFGSIFGGGRATGGPVRGGKLYEVNETGGPGELLTTGGRTFLMANQDGYVSPTRAASGGGAGGGSMTVVVQQTLHFGSDVDRSTLAAWAAQVREQTKADVLTGLNRGGALSRAVGRAA